MGMEVSPRSLGYLESAVGPEGFDGLVVTEYRDSISSEVKISGGDIENKKEAIKEAFLAWYPPQGYGSSTSENINPKRGFVLTLNRYLSCD